MLLRMYQKYCEQNNYKIVILHESNGEQGGIKSVTCEIQGEYTYGKLKGEAGVHRLVRMSPFSAKSLRHTSFALVDVMPIMSQSKMEINPNDLRIDTFRSSGPGGQNVNKLETAVRITHTPTNTVVAVQSERSQAQNKEKAMQLLISKLSALMEKHHAEQLSELRAHIEASSNEWGSQIRSYVLNPYKLVKDHRTNIESTQPERVLEGDLDQFIEAEITHTPINDHISER
jgi:peptide chain release factor 2